MTFLWLHKGHLSFGLSPASASRPLLFTLHISFSRLSTPSLSFLMTSAGGCDSGSRFFRSESGAISPSLSFVRSRSSSASTTTYRIRTIALSTAFLLLQLSITLLSKKENGLSSFFSLFARPLPFYMSLHSTLAAASACSIYSTMCLHLFFSLRACMHGFPSLFSMVLFFLSHFRTVSSLSLSLSLSPFPLTAAFPRRCKLASSCQR